MSRVMKPKRQSRFFNVIQDFEEDKYLRSLRSLTIGIYMRKGKAGRGWVSVFLIFYVLADPKWF